jgi:hypothetical protein
VVVVTSVVAFLYFVAIIYRMILMARQERSWHDILSPFRLAPTRRQNVPSTPTKTL